MQIELVDSFGNNKSFIDVPDSVFSRPYNESIVHQLVVSYQANARQGTRAQKDRSAVKHSTKKPFKQKGTGRARAGMTSSPIWRGGGKIFPSLPFENFTQKINKKMHRVAMSVIFSQLLREGRLVALESLELESPKTKELVMKLQAISSDFYTILIDNEIEDNLFFAARNLPNFWPIELRAINPLALLGCKKAFFTRVAIEKIKEIF